MVVVEINLIITEILQALRGHAYIPSVLMGFYDAPWKRLRDEYGEVTKMSIDGTSSWQ
jgi:hypothetical protein